MAVGAIASGANWITRDRFTPACWGILANASNWSGRHGSSHIQNVDLLASLADSDTNPGRVLHSKTDPAHIIIESHVECRRPIANPFDESNATPAFTSETREVLGRALLNADARGADSVDVKDLVEALVYSDASPAVIKMTLKALNVDLPALYQSLSA